MHTVLKFITLLLFSFSFTGIFPGKAYCEETKLEYYNDPPGKQEINLSGIEKKREIFSTGVISPDGTMMAYSVVYFFPNNKQFISKVFAVEKNFQIKTTDKISRLLLESGLDSLDDYIFRSLTIVDWSADNKKLLIKETTGEYFRSIWATNLWVYNFDAGYAQRFDAVRKAIIYYWKNNQKVELEDFTWDIVPLGWDVNNPDMVVVNAYGYGDSGKQFLGCWGMDTYSDSAKLLSLTNEKMPVAKNGFKFVPKK